MAANTWTNVGGDNKWGTSTNWSTLAVPTASDGNTATFDGAISTANCTLETSNKVCNAIEVKNDYTGTITFTTNLTVSGSGTLGTSMVFAGAGTLAFNATGTLTSNGVTCPQPLTLSGTNTFTISGTWTNSGTVQLGATTGTVTVNGGNLDFTGSFTHGGSTSVITGTATLRCRGTGTYTNPTSTGVLILNFVINTAGTLTFSSTNNFNYKSATLTYTAGTVVTTGATMVVFVQNNDLTVFNTNGITWASVTFTNTTGASRVVTFSSNFTLSDTLTFAGSRQITYNGAAILAGGNVTCSTTALAMPGTTTLTLNGTGTITTSGGTPIGMATTINTSGTVTFSGTVLFSGASLTYTAGTVTTTSSTLQITTGVTLDVSGITWNNVQTGSAGVVDFTVTLTSALIVGGNFTMAVNTATRTIDGSYIQVAGDILLPNITSGTVVGTSEIRKTGSGNLTMNASLTSGKLGIPVRFIDAATITIANPFRATQFILEHDITFAGASGFDVDTLTSVTAGKTNTLVAAVTYRVRSQLTMRGSSASHVSLVSDTPSTKAVFTLDNAANQSVKYVTATDIDSSGGEPIHDYRGTLTRTVNWDIQEGSGVQRGLGSALSRLRPSPCL